MSISEEIGKMNNQKTLVLPKIKCKVCGKEFKIITNNHLKKHGITIQEYREQFPDASLIPDGFKRKLLERRKQMQSRDINAILKREREQDIRDEIELKTTIKQEYIEFVKRCKKATKKHNNSCKRELSFHPISLIHDGCIWHHVNRNDVVACHPYIHTHVSHKCGDGKIEGVLG